jgi:hypothetical protein
MLMDDQVIALQYFPSVDQVAYIFTKSFIEKWFRDLWGHLGVVETLEETS